MQTDDDTIEAKEARLRAAADSSHEPIWAVTDALAVIDHYKALLAAEPLTSVSEKTEWRSPRRSSGASNCVCLTCGDWPAGEAHIQIRGNDVVVRVCESCYLAFDAETLCEAQALEGNE